MSCCDGNGSAVWVRGYVVRWVSELVRPAVVQDDGSDPRELAARLVQEFAARGFNVEVASIGVTMIPSGTGELDDLQALTRRLHAERLELDAPLGGGGVRGGSFWPYPDPF